MNIGSQRFFLPNIRLANSKSYSEFFLRNTFIRLKSWQQLKSSSLLQSSFLPTTLRRSFATHREINFGNKSSSSNGWTGRFKYNFNQYRAPLLFATGVVAFNAVAWQYIYQIPVFAELKRRPERVVYGLIGINLGVFAAWRFGRGRLLKYLDRYGLLHKDSSFRSPQMLVSAFSHIEVFHILCNMYVLWGFGIPLAKILGAERFTEVYLNGAVIGSLFSVMAPLLTGRRVLNPSLGASGAVFTVFGLLTYLSPGLNVSIMFIPIALNGFNVFMGSLGLNIAGMFYRWGAIDYAGHVGGSLVALVMGKYWKMEAEEKRRQARGRFGY